MICVLYIYIYTYIGALRDTRWAYGPGVIPLRYAVIFGTLEENRLPNLTSYRKTPSGWWLQPLKNISQLRFEIILPNTWGWVKTLVPSEPQNSW